MKLTKPSLKYNMIWNGQEVSDISKADLERNMSILLGIPLPFMSGIKASRRIRHYEPEKNLPSGIIIRLIVDIIQRHYKRLVNVFGMNLSIDALPTSNVSKKFPLPAFLRTVSRTKSRLRNSSAGVPYTAKA
jgi:CheY-like chemotaxis protein